MTAALAAGGLLLATGALVVGLLRLRARRARSRVGQPFPPYRPHSADPRGRWLITRQHPDLLDETWPLPTDHD